MKFRFLPFVSFSARNPSIRSLDRSIDGVSIRGSSWEWFGWSCRPLVNLHMKRDGESTSLSWTDEEPSRALPFEVDQVPSNSLGYFFCMDFTSLDPRVDPDSSLTEGVNRGCTVHIRGCISITTWPMPCTRDLWNSYRGPIESKNPVHDRHPSSPS